MKKGDKFDNLFVETMASEGKTIAKVDGRVIFLQGGAPGDTVEAELTKIKSNFLEGRVTAIRKLSPHRAEPFCDHFGMCGGCSWQHIDYATQLRFKQKQVVDNLERIGGLVLPEIRPIIPSAREKGYRNRLDFTFTNNRWLTKEELSASAAGNDVHAKDGTTAPHPFEPGLGYHLPRMYDRVFDVKTCHLQPEPSNAIRLAVRNLAIREHIDFFDLRRQVGFLRSLTIRTSNTGEVMTILQVAYEKTEWIEMILSMLAKEFPSITSNNYVINGKRNDTFADLDVVCYRGDPFIVEQMPRPTGGPDLQFRVGPKSFYQTNSAQAHTLYKVAFEMAALTGNELVYDLYTGTGTIANFIAGSCRKVIGLEYVNAAVEDAKVNSAINGVTNTEFFAGDIKDLLDDSFLSAHGRPDVIITDPPRVGMHAEVTQMLLQTGAKRIIYVSCNPATQARDLSTLSEKYSITAIQPVDMFPQTMHVENVGSMELGVRS